MKVGRKVPPHGGNGKLPGGIPIMRLHHKDGLNTDRTQKPVYSVKPTIHLWHESQQEFDAQFIVIIFGNSQRSLLSPTGSVKRTSSDTENHEQNGCAKVYDDKYTFKTNVDNDNSDTAYNHKHNMREV